MKKWLSALALALFAGPALGFEVNAGISGSWFNTAAPGHGFAIEYTEQPGACDQIDGQGCLVVYWFAYSPAGDPIFLIGQGPIDGNIVDLPMRHLSGMQFGSFRPSPPPMDEPWGTLRLRFSDCGSGFANYDSSFVSPAGNAYGDGNFRITRLTSIGELDCGNAPGVADLSGTGAAGLWTGTAVLEDPGGSFFVFMLIDEALRTWLFWPEPAVYVGQSAEQANGNVTGTMNAYAEPGGELQNGQTSGSANLVIDEIAPRDFIKGSLEGVGASWTFGLNWNHRFQRDPDMSRIVGQYLLQFSDNQSGSITISADGSFQASNSLGCELEGTVSPGSDSFNIFDVSATVTAADPDCEDFTGEYTGVATVLDSDSGNPSAVGFDNLLLFGLDNGERALSASGTQVFN